MIVWFLLTIGLTTISPTNQYHLPREEIEWFLNMNNIATRILEDNDFSIRRHQLLKTLNNSLTTSEEILEHLRPILPPTITLPSLNNSDKVTHMRSLVFSIGLDKELLVAFINYNRDQINLLESMMEALNRRRNFEFWLIHRLNHPYEDNGHLKSIIVSVGCTVFVAFAIMVLILVYLKKTGRLVNAKKLNDTACSLDTLQTSFDPSQVVQDSAIQDDQVECVVGDNDKRDRNIQTDDLGDEVDRKQDQDKFAEKIVDVHKNEFEESLTNHQDTEEKKRKLCMLCHINKCELMFLPCTHSTCCISCTEQLSQNSFKCPICNHSVLSVCLLYEK